MPVENCNRMELFILSTSLMANIIDSSTKYAPYLRNCSFAFKQNNNIILSLTNHLVDMSIGAIRSLNRRRLCSQHGMMGRLNNQKEKKNSGRLGSHKNRRWTNKWVYETSLYNVFHISISKDVTRLSDFDGCWNNIQ